MCHPCGRTNTPCTRHDPWWKGRDLEPPTRNDVTVSCSFTQRENFCWNMPHSGSRTVEFQTEDKAANPSHRGRSCWFMPRHPTDGVCAGRVAHPVAGVVPSGIKPCGLYERRSQSKRHSKWAMEGRYFSPPHGTSPQSHIEHELAASTSTRKFYVSRKKGAERTKSAEGLWRNHQNMGCVRQPIVACPTNPMRSFSAPDNEPQCQRGSHFPQMPPRIIRDDPNANRSAGGVCCKKGVWK